MLTAHKQRVYSKLVFNVGPMRRHCVIASETVQAERGVSL